MARKKPRVLVTANPKGGAGKTTTAINLSVISEMSGEMTALVDIDQQGLIGLWNERRNSNKPMIVETSADKLGRVIESAEDFNVSLIIIDTPAYANADIVEAINVADLVLCPSRGSLLDLGGIREMAKILQASQAMEKAIAFVNCVPPTHGEQTLKEAIGYMEKFGFRVAPCYLSHRQVFVSSLEFGRAVCDFKPKDKGSKGAIEEVEKLWNYINEVCPIITPKEKVKV